MAIKYKAAESFCHVALFVDIFHYFSLNLRTLALNNLILTKFWIYS
jgi:hypothetical protein